jgi:hypothetical protein
MQRRIFALKRDEVTGEWRKLHNEEPSIIRMIKSRMMGGACSTPGKNRNAYRLFVGKPEERDR